MSVYDARPWLKHYDEHVPAHLSYPECSYADLFERTLELGANNAALYYLGRKLTYGQLDQWSDALANYFFSLGLRAGDVVGVHLPNLPAYYLALLAAQKTGLVITGVSPLLTAEELVYQLNDAGVRCLLTADFHFERVAQVLDQTGVEHVLVTSIADFMLSLKKALGNFLHKIPRGPVYQVHEIKPKALLSVLDEFSDPFVRVQIDPEALMFLQYTGGTTGPPKGAELSQKNIVSHITQFQVWLNRQHTNECVLTAFPMFHQAGLFLSLFSLALGFAQVIVPNPRDIGFLIKMAKKYRPKAMGHVPTIYLELLKQESFRNLDFSDLEWLGSGAAPFPPEYIKDLETVVGKGKLIEVCGMTETSPILTSQPLYGEKRIGSIGLPLPDTEVRLVEPGTDQDVDVGEAGELLVKGPQVFSGYHNREKETRNSFSDGWFHTGDVCRMDEDGFFYIVDRLKDMVNVSGFKVFTRTVDDVVMEHPDVDLAATVGLPDPDRPGSEQVVTAVVLHQGLVPSQELEQDLRNYLRERLAPYKVPKRIEFMDSLPTSAVGKILKKDLRKVLMGS